MSRLSPDLLRQFDVAGPRYTSYPTADRFVEAFGAAEYGQALDECALRPAAQAQPLSLYVHIPFCESVCYYCACNKIVTKQHGRAATYLRYLEREMAFNTERLGRGRTVTQLHLGGGTPTFLSDDELAQLMAAIRRHFALAAGAECSIEVDPRTVTSARLQVLADLGFNRLSFGVQDFDPEVQKAVHRIQPASDVFALMRAAREIGFDSINADLIYGLPRQTEASFARTLRQVAELRPDRIALYGYAHLPERFKPQRRIVAADLPAAADKVAMLTSAIDAFLEAGYDYIGMDHFALPGDALAVAKREGRLQRNFQGYSTQADCDLIGLGVSAIGRIGATYSQNAKTIEAWCDLLDQSRLPVERGLALTRDDLARRAVIMAIMCKGEVLFEAVEASWLLDFGKYFAAEMRQLEPLRQAGLVEVDERGIRTTASGWFVVRAIAMVFDRYLQANRTRAQFSKIL
ncbi:oxygen-independent coproporphyrinogen III oxidase [Ramlibacter sp.]|uniref:oxygen-independent coproporphyrinogen III oxidase n=1 Tax=Ramlibacter sp. TaxID=1917967 RepID=UPI003D14A0D4